MSLTDLQSPAQFKAGSVSRKRGLGLVLTLLAFALCSQVLRLSGNPSGPAWGGLRAIRQPLEIAIVGDSRAHVGLSPDKLGAPWLFPENAGPKVYNFAVDGSDALQHASFMMHGLLKQETPPKLIVWAPNPLGFNRERTNNRVEQLLPADLPFLCKNGSPLEPLLDICTSAIFTPYRHRANVAQRVNDFTDRLAWMAVHVQTRILKLTHTPVPPPREYFPREAGYVPFKILNWPARFDRGVADYAEKYASARLSERHLLAARDLLTAARRVGTHVVILEMPVAAWYVDNLTSKEFHAAWRRRMEKLANLEGATFIQDAAAVGGNEGFGDPGHMSFETSQSYSAKLAWKLEGIPAVRAALGRVDAEEPL